MTDLTPTIQAKSDQLNADDLIGNTKTIKVTKVAAGSGDDQPVTIHYEGENGRPYKPCKSMRRVLVAAWGADGSKYAGKSMTLFNDQTVTWAGVAVGGIRISHLSHIDKDLALGIQVTRGKKIRWEVKKLTVKEEKQVEAGLYDKAMKAGDEVAGKGLDAYKEWFKSIDQSQFTAEQKQLFADCHTKWKDIAANADADDEECPV